MDDLCLFSFGIYSAIASFYLKPLDWRIGIAFHKGKFSETGLIDNIFTINIPTLEFHVWWFTLNDPKD